MAQERFCLNNCQTWAISSLSDGVVIGSGLVFYEVSNMLDDKNNGNKLLKNALKFPLKQINYTPKGLNLIFFVKQIIFVSITFLRGK